MRIGPLRHRVVIQSETATQDTYGGEVLTWSTVATVWAAVEPLTGREFLEGRGLEASVDTRIRVRYRSGLGPTMRVTWGTHTYDILAVLELKHEHREIHLMCREIVTD